MAMARSRRREGRADYWPGFVDAMATLLLVIIFLLSVFMLAQFFLSQEITGRDAVLNRLNAEISALKEALALTSAENTSLGETLAIFESNLASAEADRDRLQGLLDTQEGAADLAGGKVTDLQGQLAEKDRISQRALAQVELLNRQIAALRKQISALESALDVSKDKDREAQAKIADLGKRLNVALAQRVQELARYRSDFFGRLREILSQRSDIRVVGDRFVFQSEVLFSAGNDAVNTEGQTELDKLAEAILELSGQIPSEIDWVLRVDGHTDKRPIRSSRFPSNWELSAARAISVVKYLVSKGVPAKNLVAAGFGEFQPLEEGETDEDYAKNRRIELKLTQR